MSYKTIYYYTPKCDDCHKTLKAYFTTEDEADAYAHKQGWIKVAGKHLCEECARSEVTVMRSKL